MMCFVSIPFLFQNSISIKAVGVLAEIIIQEFQNQIGWLNLIDILNQPKEFFPQLSRSNDFYVLHVLISQRDIPMLTIANGFPILQL